MRDFVDLNELYPLIKEVIESGGTFRIFPRGISMLPLIKEGEDEIVLGAVDKINIGDVLFYQRENGDFVLHRLINIHRGTLIMCGDNQRALERGIKPQQVLAKMVGYCKKGQFHSIDEPEYIKYSKGKVKRFPFYRKNTDIYDFLRKCKRIIKKS